MFPCLNRSRTGVKCSDKWSGRAFYNKERLIIQLQDKWSSLPVSKNSFPPYLHLAQVLPSPLAKALSSLHVGHPVIINSVHIANAVCFYAIVRFGSRHLWCRRRTPVIRVADPSQAECGYVSVFI